MTPEQTAALIALVTSYQQAFRADVAADGIDTPRYRRLTAAHAALLDWREPAWDAEDDELLQSSMADVDAGLPAMPPWTTATGVPTVGCEDADGLLTIHPESETCAVCAPTVHTPTTPKRPFSALVAKMSPEAQAHVAAETARLLAEGDPMTTPDDASPHVVLRYLRDSVAKWEPNARLLANARASDILRALDDALSAGTCGTCANSEDVSPFVSHLWCHVHDQARAPDDGCRLGYKAKATPAP